MFAQNPKQATRTRNYFSPNIHIPAITVSWQIAKDAQLQFVSSAVLGTRSSVLFDKQANVADTINLFTNQYNNRQVDIDQFKSFTYELRWLQSYRIGQQKHHLAAGLQFMNNDLHRRQLGKGTTGNYYDLSLVSPVWGRDLHFKTKNLAVYAENSWAVTKQLSLTGGVRIEAGHSDMSGQITYYPSNQIPLQLKHNFPLFGAAMAYKFKKLGEYYMGWSQSYRPMIFKDLIPASVYEKVDANLKDATGFNAEMGWRGQYKNLRWDISAFLLRYNNRFGTIANLDEQGQLYTWRTNVGNSVTKGLELFTQADWVIGKQSFISTFITASYMHARYISGQIKSGNSNVDLEGKKVESAPDWMFKTGATIRKQRFSFSALYSYTGETFADPINTLQPTPATGAVGLVPAYQLMDITVTYKVMKAVELKCSVNNLFNVSYFTKRPLFYPGPGIWPSDGRNISATVIMKL
jgi:Fe(3+) dicitrate transport protein